MGLDSFDDPTAIRQRKESFLTPGIVGGEEQVIPDINAAQLPPQMQ